MTPEPLNAFPCACPRCGTVAGFPYCVRTDADPRRVRVELRCRDCRHEWVVERTSPALGPHNFTDGPGTGERDRR